MSIKKWDKEETHYELLDGYSLEKADRDEYSKYYAIYMNIDIGFKASYEQRRAAVSEEDTCFWIFKDKIRIAGVFIKPNYIEGMFTIPPYENRYKVLELLKEVQLCWSDRTKEIKAVLVSPGDVDYYQRLGFRAGNMGRWMIRPTALFDVQWEDEFEVTTPSSETPERLPGSLEDSLGELFFHAFKEDCSDIKYSLEERTSFVKYYFDHNSQNELLMKASTLLYDRNTQELIGACLVSEYNGWPLIYDIAVKASYRGKGLARKMLQKAISVSNEKYPAIRLYVLCGNPAESLYHKVGFMPGVKLTRLLMPAQVCS